MVYLDDENAEATPPAEGGEQAAEGGEAAPEGDKGGADA